MKKTANDDVSETHTLVGVSSFVMGGCANDRADGFASTSAGAPWIKETVCDTWGLDASFCPKTPGKSTKAPKKSSNKSMKKAKAEPEPNCDVQVVIDVGLDYYSYAETSFYLQNDATGEIVLDVPDFSGETSPQVFGSLCSGESYTAVLQDSYGDGQYWTASSCCTFNDPNDPIDDAFCFPWFPYFDPDNCPPAGMIGTLSNSGEVIFDKLGWWAGESLQATFVVP